MATLGGLLALVLSACTPSHVRHTAPVRVLAEAGRYDEALRELDAEAARASLDPLLVAADRGGLLHRAGDWERSGQSLREAAALADARETVRLSEEIFGSAPWRMGTLERQALHTLNALNHLQRGQLEEAAVEARFTNVLNLRQHLEAVHRAKLERDVTLMAFDEDFRVYLERSAIGLYVSALAHELAGNEDSAFIDYLAAWQVTRKAPPGAPSHLTHLVPRLVAEARRLGRPELAELEGLLPAGEGAVTPEPGGELVVIIEAGRIPERCLLPRGESLVWSVCARDWSHAKAQVEVGGNTVTAETVTSLENLLLRRGALGAFTDTERAPSLSVNLGMFVGFLLVPPVGAAMIIRRVGEVNNRMAQSWLSLPAEFQVARLRLPLGRHSVRVGAQVREVDLTSRTQVLVMQMD